MKKFILSFEKNTYIKFILKNEWIFILAAFLLPLLFYGNVFIGRSFGFECAPGVMGLQAPYGQTMTGANWYCSTILDPGAYTWQHPAHWVNVMRQYMSGHFPTWAQNIATGFPLAANFQSDAYYLLILPFTFLFQLSNHNFLFIDLFLVFRYMMLSGGMYLFLRSLKLNRIISLTGAIALFSSGYYITIPALAHHNVDILLPFIGWAINNTYFKRSTKWLGISILTLGLSMLGGMPESSMFILFFTSTYATFLSFFFVKENKLRYFLYGASITLFGLLISAILYFPGIEFILSGLSAHHSGGSQKFTDIHNFILLIQPKIFGGGNLFWDGYRQLIDFNPDSWNYVGTAIFYLFLTNLIFFIPFVRRIKKDPIVYIYIYFLGLSILLLLQLYGIVHFFFFEYFPGFKETQFTKYSSSLINFSVIASACFAVSQMMDTKTKKIFLLYPVVSAFLFYLSFHYHAIIIADPYISKIKGISTNALYGFFFISVITFAYYFLRKKLILATIIAFIVFSEFVYYFPKHGDQTRRNSFNTPPAVKFLQSKNYHEFRILGIDYLLFPNLATVYDLNDIRLLDALWIGRYFEYMKAFYAEPDVFRITGIRESNATQSADIISNPYFDMMSVKYVLSYQNINNLVDNPLIDQIIAQNKKSDKLNRATFSIKKDTKDVLFEHAPNSIKATITKPEGAEYLTLYPALPDTLFGTHQSDGVRFVVTASKDDTVIYTNEITDDASNKASDQKWFTVKVGPFPDIESSYQFTLELQTDQLKGNAFDWAGWGGFEWDSSTKKISDKYKLVYDKEMKIYENNTYIPRVRFINNVICAPNEKDVAKNYQNVIDLMKKNKENITKIAIVEDQNCQNKNYNPQKGKISNTNFQDEKISFTYSSSEDQYGLLSDTYYAGWKIYINGKEGRIKPTNLAFRGFVLPKGNNVKVEVVYDPLSFKLGLFISLISIVLAVYLIVRNKRI